MIAVVRHRLVVLGLIAFAAAVALSQTARVSRPAIGYTPRAIPVKGLEAFKAGTWRSLLADVFYIRGGLSLSDEAPWDARLDWVWTYLGAALTLDPRMSDAYFLGGVVAPRTPHQIKKGIRFLKRYRGLNPDDWRVLYWIGFDYLQLQDYTNASRFYRLAARLPGAPDFLKSNPAMMAYLGNNLRAGIIYLEALLERVADEEQRQWILIKREWMRRLLSLQEAAQAYHRIKGRYPLYLDELVESGLLPAIPGDPFGDGFYWDPDEKRVKSLFLGLSQPAAGSGSL